MAEPTHYLVAGLGNPGRQYEKTRHNVGFMIIDKLAEKNDIPIGRLKFNASFNRGCIAGREVVLAKPQAFMNRSGPPLYALAGFFKIPPAAMIVIHDDIDLAFDRLKIKEKGGDGGHKGIRSIIQAFGDDQFIRLRVGVGRPSPDSDAAEYVLNGFSSDEKAVLGSTIEKACDAVETILTEGIIEGMNRFNRLLS
jgi:PTH1 family peptidyl-tRNA hydrolase